MIEVTAHGIVGEGLVSVGDAGVFTLEMSPGRWIGRQDPMIAHVAVQRDDCDQLAEIYVPGIGVVVSGELVGEEADGRSRLVVTASEIIKSDAVGHDGRVRHHFMRGHAVGRVKRDPSWSDRFCNFDLVSWSESGMTRLDCKLAGSMEVTNFRRRFYGQGTRLSLLGDVREHRFVDRSGVERNRLAFDVDRWEVVR